jgi:hypothetical protein
MPNWTAFVNRPDWAAFVGPACDPVVKRLKTVWYYASWDGPWQRRLAKWAVLVYRPPWAKVDLDRRAGRRKLGIIRGILVGPRSSNQIACETRILSLKCSRTGSPKARRCSRVNVVSRFGGAPRDTRTGWNLLQWWIFPLQRGSFCAQDALQKKQPHSAHSSAIRVLSSFPQVVHTHFVASSSSERPSASLVAMVDPFRI